MVPSDKVKIKLLVKVAKMYYDEHLNQNEIADRIGVSRPLISKYLSDARELGIVEIKIHDLLVETKADSDLIKERYGLRQCIVVPYSVNEGLMSAWLSQQAVQFFLNDLQHKELRIGLGWGSTIGEMAAKISELPVNRKLSGSIVPLIGNAPTSNRNYHTNELVRLMSLTTGLAPNYIYTPVICSTALEKEVLEQAESYRTVKKLWDNLDYVLLNIRNHPSTPDLATAARFDNLLNEQHAVGMLLGYYFNQDGKFITSSNDFVMQIDLPQLRKARKVVAMASHRVSPKAIVGALNTGLLTHLIIDSNNAKALIELI